MQGHDRTLRPNEIHDLADHHAMEAPVLDYARPRKQNQKGRVLGLILGYGIGMCVIIGAGVTANLLGVHSSTKDDLGLWLLPVVPAIMALGVYVGGRFL